jgi:hypothetical protein
MTRGSGVEVLGRLSGLGERPGDRVLGELVVKAAPSGGGHTTPLTTLAGVGSEAGEPGIGARLRLAVKDRFREREGGSQVGWEPTVSIVPTDGARIPQDCPYGRLRRA